jgi:hypothetical protein
MTPTNRNGIRRRKRFFVDPKVQGGLLLRTIMQWIGCVVSVTAILIIWRVVGTGPARPFYMQLDDLWFRYGPVLIASSLLVPLVLFDVVRYSNRFVGPMIRLRNAMQKVARGERVEPVQFRDSDLWQEFATEFNAVLKRIESLQAKAESAGESDKSAESSSDSREAALVT